MTDKLFVEKFLSVFAKGINENQMRKCGIRKKKGYLWNLLGCKVVPCLEGELARAEYNKVDKTDAFEVLYMSPNILEIFERTEALSDLHLTAEDIDEAGLVEFYIIGKDFAWCYVVTHAGDGAGPYFCYAPAQS